MAPFVRHGSSTLSRLPNGLTALVEMSLGGVRPITGNTTLITSNPEQNPCFVFWRALEKNIAQY